MTIEPSGNGGGYQIWASQQEGTVDEGMMRMMMERKEGVISNCEPVGWTNKNHFSKRWADVESKSFVDGSDKGFPSRLLIGENISAGN